MSEQVEWDAIKAHLLDGLDDVFMHILRIGEDGDRGNDAWHTFVEDCRVRYEAGRAQHKDAESTWDDWSLEDFVKNIREEIIDACIYAARRSATYPTDRR